MCLPTTVWVRGQTLSIKQDLYIEPPTAWAQNPFTILWRYIFPNTVSSIVVLFSVNVADAILTEAGLSFLGLACPPMCRIGALPCHVDSRPFAAMAG